MDDKRGRGFAKSVAARIRWPVMAADVDAIESAIRAAVAEETERCANVCDLRAMEARPSHRAIEAAACADAIRALKPVLPLSREKGDA